MSKRAKVEPVEAEPVETLVSDPNVAKELDVSLMTIWRYDRDPRLAELGWPPKISIRDRNFRNRRLFETFKRNLLRHAMTKRGA
jgi:hypothetical protein